MNKNEIYLFNLLKKALESTFLATNKAPVSIKDWKGKDIVAFQEELFDKVKAKVSEKWFYTYIKKEANTLPRIDILNFLSEYAGFKNWNAFVAAHKQELETTKRTKSTKKIIGLVALLGIIISLFYFSTAKNEFQFCFYDTDKNEPIQSYLDIKIIQKKQSPIFLKTDSLGCFSYKTKEKNIQFVVQSPYYKTDTIVRFIHSNTNNRIHLKTDDYALMLQYYANGNTKDWKKRRKQLMNLIADNAQIYQLFNQSINIELYAKEEFIRKLTTPTSSLKNIEILDKTFHNGKIVKLKFRIK